MGLFNKKLSLEEILKAIEGLSEEEKAQVKAKMEEPKEEETEVAQEVESDTTEVESEEPVEQAEEPTEEVQEEATKEVAEENVEETAETTPETEKLNPVEEDNKEDVFSGLADRIQALEERLAELDELKALMEDFTKKQADSFGYKGAIPGAKKDIHEMSASELRQKIQNGEI